MLTMPTDASLVKKGSGMTLAAILRAIYRAYISPSKPKTSYSQYGEDLLIQLLIDDRKKKGVYVDVGCHHPRRGSNTYGLYRRGWRGLLVDIEQDKVLACRLARPRDTAVLAAVSDREEDVSVFSPNSFSTNATIVADSVGQGYEKVGELRSKTLDVILSEHGIGAEFDLLSIDVEGADFSVLKGLDLARYRPRIVCIENWDSRNGIEAILHSEIHRHLDAAGYRLAAWAGLSTLYRRV